MNELKRSMTITPKVRDLLRAVKRKKGYQCQKVARIDATGGRGVTTNKKGGKWINEVEKEKK